MNIKLPYWQIIAVPLLLAFSGAASNQAVLVANWGKFPVMLNSAEIQKLQSSEEEREMEQIISAIIGQAHHKSIIWDSAIPTTAAQNANSDDMIDDTHCIMSKTNRLKFLADWINLGGHIASPGDLGIWLGSWLFSFAPIVWLTLVVKKLWGNV